MKTEYKQLADEDFERFPFEDFLSNTHYKVDLTIAKNGRYNDPAVQLAWEAWKQAIHQSY